jgi:hypothetical protein
MRWLIILLLTGCSFTPLEEQYDNAVACQIDCDSLWNKYYERESYERRHAQPSCNGGVIFGDGRYNKQNCMSSQDLDRMLEIML